MLIYNTQDGYQINIPTSFHGYDVLKLIGCGSTCVVVLIENQITKEKYSAKIISKIDAINRNLINAIYREINVLKILTHPNIIQLQEYFEIKNEYEDEFIIIVTEYCENGDLLAYITEKGFESETIKKRIISDFLKAIQYLHQQGISHGDIKAENILLDSNLNAKLCDFGYCRTHVIEGDSFKNGTLYYAAPELFHSGCFNTLSADIYSIGITLYSLSELQFPFQSGNQEFIVQQIVNGCLYIQCGLNRKLRRLVMKCTSMNPKNRPSIDDILKDEYLNDEIDLEKDNNKTLKQKHLYAQISNENKKNKAKYSSYNQFLEYESEI